MLSALMLMILSLSLSSLSLSLSLEYGITNYTTNDYIISHAWSAEQLRSFYPISQLLDIRRPALEALCRIYCGSVCGHLVAFAHYDTFGDFESLGGFTRSTQAHTHTPTGAFVS